MQTSYNEHHQIQIDSVINAQHPPRPDMRSEGGFFDIEKAFSEQQPFVFYFFLSFFLFVSLFYYDFLKGFALDKEKRLAMEAYKKF